jgi:hypothetical protein
MRLDEFRLEMESYRQAVEVEAKSFKDSYIAIDRLRALYKKFDADESLMADQVLGEWVLSEQEKIRFEAMVLIDDFKIITATPALLKLADRLALMTTPGAPYELEKVNRIIEDLGRYSV